MRSDGDARPDRGRSSPRGGAGLSLRAHLLAFALAVLLPALALGAGTAWHLVSTYRRAFEAGLGGNPPPPSPPPPKRGGPPRGAASGLLPPPPPAPPARGGEGGLLSF